MSRSAKIWTLLCAAIILLSVSYVLTFGHCFLPKPKPDTFRNERIEIRTFSGFFVPSQSNTVAGFLARMKWRCLYPGQVRLISVADNDHLLRKALEKMGYSFPRGCSARIGDNIPMEITHYPSVLSRIEKDLHLTVTWRAPIGSDGEPMTKQVDQPTRGGGTTGETNRQSDSPGPSN